MSLIKNHPIPMEVTEIRCLNGHECDILDLALFMMANNPGPLREQARMLHDQKMFDRLMWAPKAQS